MLYLQVLETIQKKYWASIYAVVICRIVKYISRTRETGFQNDCTAVKFDKYLYNTTVEEPGKHENDQYLTISRSYVTTRYLVARRFIT